MTRQLARRALILGAPALACACAQPTRRLPPLPEGVSAVEVRAHGRGTPTPSQSLNLVSTITDNQRVARLVAFCNARLEGWHIPLAGSPVPSVRANYLRGDERVDDLGAGRGFFNRAILETRDASASEIAEFIGLLGLDEGVLDWS